MIKYSMKLIFLALTFFIGLTYCKSQNPKTYSQLIRSDYKEKISILFNDIANNKMIDDSLLLYSFPQSEEEYLAIYDYTNPDTSKLLKEAYSKRHILIAEKLKTGNIEYLKKQMIFSEFVDGEEAEGFFEGLEYYYKLNPDNFCKAYKYLEKKYGKERFKSLQTLEIACLKN
jgi:hypothetical protein